jgi:hypothetical protein
MIKIIKRFWWIVPIVIVLIIAIYAYFYEINNHINPEQLTKTELILKSGITIEDDKNDFASMGGAKDRPDVKPNNPIAYTYPYLDIKSVTAAIDKDNLYFKIQFYDTIPEKATQIKDDKIIDNGTKFNLVNEKGEDQLILVLNYNYLPLSMNITGTYYFYGPTGIVDPEPQRFSERGSDSKIYGGPSSDYLIGILPLEKTGIVYGQVIYFTVSNESGSIKFDHASVDSLGGQGKQPALIKWNTGTNDFEVINNFYK